MLQNLWQYFTEGIFFPPPPFMHNKTIYSLFSQNTICVSTGKLGLQWGEMYRSQIMIFAFIISLISFLFLFLCLLSLSHYGNIIKNIPLFYGKAFAVGTEIDKGTDFYSGVTMIQFSCTGDDNDDCNKQYVYNDIGCHDKSNLLSYDSCEICMDASHDLTATVIIGFVTLIPQIITDLARSKVIGDYNCMKFLGIITGIIGLVTTLSSIFAFQINCYNIIDEIDKYIIIKSLGLTYYLLLIATLLKVVDIFAHLIVPVPRKGYFGSSDQDIDDENEYEESSILMTEFSSHIDK